MTQEQTPKVYAALRALQASLEAIPKAKTIAFGERFNYRGIDDVQLAFFAPMQAHGLMIVDVDIAYELVPYTTGKGVAATHILCTYRGAWVSLEDGSRLEFTALGEGMDSHDKAANKAKSNALKYALLHQFCIPTEATPDPDGMPVGAAQELDLLNAAKRCKTKAELRTLFVNANKPENLEAEFAEIAKTLTQ